jgi:hypothetical protein
MRETKSRMIHDVGVAPENTWDAPRFASIMSTSGTRRMGDCAVFFEAGFGTVSCSVEGFEGTALFFSTASTNVAPSVAVASLEPSSEDEDRDDEGSLGTGLAV